eukprot:TRINITY_DN14098_c0_g1_i2.p1 TRINITY_DN14098_c0_g1~~TRINITY_DN14098_c0_g1_i2.p1  ORF type:complete len:510 (+),score=93.98 TRINITY_DN14098_c0_g1_i2:87-1532(+)
MAVAESEDPLPPPAPTNTSKGRTASVVPKKPPSAENEGSCAAADKGKASDISSSVWVMTVTTWLAYCMQSLAASMMGPLLPDMARLSGSSVAELSSLVPAFMWGGAAGAAVAGRAFDTTASASDPSGVVRQASLGLLGALLLGIAMTHASMAFIGGRMGLAAVCFLQGICDGSFRTGANWVMLRLHAADKVAPFVLTMHFCSGAGRFLAGVLGARYAGKDDISWGFLLASLAALVLSQALVIVAVLVADKADTKSVRDAVVSGDKQKTDAKDEAEPAGTSAFVMTVAMFVFLVMGVQNAFQYLVTAYARAASPPLEFTTGAAAAKLSAYYGFAFAAGRLVSIPLSTRLTTAQLLRLSMAATVTALFAVVLAPGSSLAILGAATLLGLALSSVFPSAINYAKQTLGAAMKGSRLSLLMLSGTAGGGAIPPLAGQFLGGGSLEGWGAPAMMQLLLITALAAGAVLLAANGLERDLAGNAKKTD